MELKQTLAERIAWLVGVFVITCMFVSATAFLGIQQACLICKDVQQQVFDPQAMLFGICLAMYAAIPVASVIS